MSEVSDRIDLLALGRLFESEGWKVFERCVLAGIVESSEAVIMGPKATFHSKQFEMHQAIGAQKAIREIMTAKAACGESLARGESDLAAQDFPRDASDTRHGREESESGAAGSSGEALTTSAPT